MNSIQYKATTPEDQDLGRFTRRNLKRLSTWDELEQGKINQLSQMNYLGMFGKPIYAPNNAIVLRPHWKYSTNQNGTCGYIQVRDGPKRDAPMMR